MTIRITVKNEDEEINVEATPVEDELIHPSVVIGPGEQYEFYLHRTKTIELKEQFPCKVCGAPLTKEGDCPNDTEVKDA